jgi:hypothetical protein
MLFSLKDIANVKEEKINNVKLLKKSAFGHTEPSVRFVEKESQ